MRAVYLHFFSILLVACGNDGYTSSPVQVTAESGSTVELTGTWRSACYSDGVNYLIDIRIYSSNGHLSSSRAKYDLADTSCSSLLSEDVYATDARVHVGTDKTVSGWKDGAGNDDTAPDSQSGSALSDTPTVSKYWYVLDNSLTTKSLDLIDDSVTDNWVMYRADELGGRDSGGYNDYLATANPLFKE